jgi:hypothetical protein
MQDVASARRAISVQVEGSAEGVACLRHIALLYPGDDRTIGRRNIGQVDLHEVARRVANVHLHRAVRQLLDFGGKVVFVFYSEFLRLSISRLEAVHVYAEVVPRGSRHLALEEV